MKLQRLKNLCFTLACLLTCTLGESQASQAPLRVGFLPQVEGFYFIEENGGYAGYSYHYLMEISEYTDWSYEFVVINEGWDSYRVAKEMLLSGELDLLGPMFTDDEMSDKFIYGEENNGLSRYTLCTSASSRLTVDNYFFQDLITVALVESDTGAAAAFYSLMERYDIPYQVTFVESQDLALAKLMNREVDTVMSMDVYSSYGVLDPLDTVNPTPFYFITAPDKADLIETLDDAVRQLNIAEPGLHQRLLETFFTNSYEGDLILSAEEQKALEGYDYFNVGLLRNQEPYQFNDGNVTGISPEILNLISEIIGVKFRYVWVDSYEEMEEKVASNEIDLCATLPFDYELSPRFDVVLTRPYVTSGVLWLHQNDESEEVQYYYHFVSDNIPQIPDEDLIRVVDIEETIQKLADSGDITLICDPYIAQYYLQKMSIINVDMQNMNHIHSEITIGVSKKIDAAVVGLLNRAILHLDPFDVDEIVYRNVTNTGMISLQAFVQQNVSQVLLYISLFFALILGSMAYHARKLRILSQQDGLTKLYNSGYFHHYAAEKSTKLSEGALILFDIDYFKQVNDTHGHQTGDKVIISVAQNVKKIFPHHAVVARLGGDEFVVLVEGEQHGMEEKCQNLLNTLDTAVEHVPVSLSIGGVRFHAPCQYKELYRLADECLYEVKENGKHGFRFGEK